MKIVLWLLLVLAALYIVFVIGPSVVCFYFIFKRQPLRDFETEDFTGTHYADFEKEIRSAVIKAKTLPFERVEIRSADGLLLRGFYLDSGYNKTVICVHGYRGNPLNNFAVLADFLTGEGFNLLFMEQRASNGSEGKLSSMGLLEQNDVKSWIRFADRRGADEILLYGMSMGATTLGLMADKIRNRKVKAIIWDAGFTSPKNQLLKQANDRHAPGPIMIPIVRALGYLFFRADLYDNVMDHFGKTTIPVLFLHAKDDATVPPSDTQEAYESCKSPKMKLITEKGGHTTAFLAGGEKARDMIHTFIQANYET